MELIVLAFSTVFLAEIGDKSQLVTLFMSARRSAIQVYLGSITALMLNIGGVVLFGTLIRNLVPDHIITVISGLLFITIGVIGYLNKDLELEEKSQSYSTFFTVFVLVFFAEMGDKTQLTVLTLATVTGAPVLVFFGALLAQMVNTGLVAFLGARYVSRISRPRLQLISSLVFIIIGAIILVF